MPAAAKTEAERAGGIRKRLDRSVPAHAVRIRVSGVRVGHPPTREVEHEMREGHERPPFGRPDDFLVEQLHETHTACTCPGQHAEGRLRGGHHEPGRQTVTRDIGHTHGEDVFRVRKIVEVASDGGRGREVHGDPDTRAREVRGGKEAPLEVACDGELALEGLLLGLLRDARAEMRGHRVEARDESRELILTLEDDAVREVAFLDLGESRREPPRGAGDPIDEEAGEEGGSREDDERSRSRARPWRRGRRGSSRGARTPRQPPS